MLNIIEHLIAELSHQGITDGVVLDAIKGVPRDKFVLEKNQYQAIWK